MIDFRRKSVGTELIDEVFTRAASGKSTVLLGPRFGGKRHVMRAVRDRLIELPGSAVIYQSSSGPGLDIWIDGEHSRAEGDIVHTANRLHASLAKPVTLCLEVLSSLPHHQARKLLSHIRTQVESRRMSVLLAGECNLRELVHGPRSEFNCATQFILQGYDLPEFTKYMREFSGAANIKWTSEADAASVLHKITGGNVYLLRMMLALVFDWRAEGVIDNDEPVDPSRFRDHTLRLKALPEAYWAHIFRHGAEAVASDPDCWSNLEELVHNRRCRVGLIGEPSTLELSGFAVFWGGELTVESELVADYLRQYFSKRKLADLHGQDGQWGEAFRRYKLLQQPAELIRPADSDDVRDVERLVASLGAAMHKASADGREKVEKLLSRGARYVLGFREVSFWHKAEAGWLLEPGAAGPSLRESVGECGQMLNEANEQIGWIKLSGAYPQARVAAGVIMRTEHSSVLRAAIISDFSGGTVISHQREKLLESLCRDFTKAHSDAVDAETNRQRLASRDAHIDILTKLFSQLGSRLLDQETLLCHCSRALLGLDYKRVMFSLIDPDRALIKGAWDEPGTPVNLAKMTEYSLEKEIRDVQPWVVKHGIAKIIPDASNEPLCNPDAVRGANLRAMAVVPIFGSADMVTGTIHIERKDGAVPSRQEVDDLILFGRILAGLISQVRRMTMIYQSLNKLPEPLLILDTRGQAKFANTPATDLFPAIASGWLDNPTEISGAGAEKVSEWFNHAQKKGRHVSQVSRIGCNPKFQAEVLAVRIEDIGVVLHIEDQNFLSRVFEAIRTIGAADSRETLVERMFEAFELLDFEKLRYYEFSQVDDCLVSKKSRGMSPEKAALFNADAIRLGRDEEESWRCIVEERPAVFVLDRHAPEGEATRPNKWGLELLVLRDESHDSIIDKKDGSVRVDVGMGAGPILLGKFSLERAVDLKPEELDLIGTLARQGRRILQTIADRERIDNIKRLEDGTRRALQIASHQFRNDLTPLKARIAKIHYWALDNNIQDAKFRSIIDGVNSGVGQLHRIIDCIPEFLADINPRLENFDIADTLRNGLGRRDIRITVNAPDSVLITADRSHVISVMNELLSNSVSMWRGPAGHSPKASMSIVAFPQEPTTGIRIIYEDNGPGIPDGIRESRIFDLAFSYRPDQSTGTGVGLNYAKRVLRAHGGDIRTEKAEKGARFVLDLPQCIVNS